MIQATVPRRPHWISPASLGHAKLVAVKYLAVLFAALLAAGPASAGAVDLAGKPRDPFAAPAQARVFVFMRTDCPITNRYAPELRRLSDLFAADAVQFWLIYPDPSETVDKIQKHRLDYDFPGQPLRDPGYELVKRAHAATAPEAAVFDSKGALVYHGRIDDLWVTPGRARPMATTHELEDAITAVLTGKPPKLPETRAVGCSLADVQK
jgi:hypothetical protein